MRANRPQSALLVAGFVLLPIWSARVGGTLDEIAAGGVRRAEASRFHTALRELVHRAD
jgi:hypothetical protein